MKYRKRETGEIVSKKQLESDNPNVSFPKHWNENIYDFLNVDPVHSSTLPDISDYETLEEGTPVQDANGDWYESWNIVPRFTTQEEIDAYDAQRIAGYAVSKKKVQAYLKSINAWGMFKRIRNAHPEYIDGWDSTEAIDVNNELLKTLSQGIGQTVETLVNNANALSDNPEQITPAEELELVKNRSKMLINSERDRRKYADVTYEGNQYSVSEWDIMMITRLLQTSNSGKALPTDDYWRTANNVNVNLNNTDLNNLDELIRAQIQTAYQWSWIKKAEIDACTTIAEVEAVDLELIVD